MTLVGATNDADLRARVQELVNDAKKVKKLSDQMKAAFIIAIEIGIRRISEIMAKLMISKDDIMRWRNCLLVQIEHNKLKGLPEPIPA